MFKKSLILFSVLFLISCSNSSRDLNVSADASSIQTTVTLENSSIDGDISIKFYDIMIPFSFNIPDVRTFKANIILKEVSFFNGEIISKITCPVGNNISLDLYFDNYEIAVLDAEKDIFNCVGSDSNIYTIRFKAQDSNESHGIITSFDFIDKVFLGQVIVKRVGDEQYKELYF